MPKREPLYVKQIGGAYWIMIDDLPRVRRWLNKHLGTVKAGRWRMWQWTTQRQYNKLDYEDEYLCCTVLVIWHAVDATRFEGWVREH